MKIFPSGQGAIYFKWWFWLGLLVLVCAALYAVRATSWNAQNLSDHVEDFARNSAMSVIDFNQKQLEKQYREDTYGGDTPEETMRLYIEAIEKKDYALAVKYYVPEKRDEAKRNFAGAEEGALDRFTAAYRTGSSKSYLSKDENDAQIDIFPKGETSAFITVFRKNPFTNKWKITE